MAKQNGLKELPPGVPEERTPTPGGLGEGKPPQFGTGRPADPDGPVPRVITQLERAPNRSLSRFKIRCNNYHPQKTRYILAKDEASAKACYLAANGLDKLIEKLKKSTPAGEKVEEPDLAVTELED